MTINKWNKEMKRLLILCSEAEIFKVGKYLLEGNPDSDIELLENVIVDLSYSKSSKKIKWLATLANKLIEAYAKLEPL